jgi:hypothetical protein
MISYFLHKAAENMAIWQFRLAQWYVFLMAILGG